MATMLLFNGLIGFFGGSIRGLYEDRTQYIATYSTIVGLIGRAYGAGRGGFIGI